MKFELYQDGEQIANHKWDLGWLVCQIDYKATVNQFLEFLDTEPADENKMTVVHSSKSVTRVMWVDGAKNDACYSMVATFIEN